MKFDVESILNKNIENVGGMSHLIGTQGLDPARGSLTNEQQLKRVQELDKAEGVHASEHDVSEMNDSDEDEDNDEINTKSDSDFENNNGEMDDEDEDDASFDEGNSEKYLHTSMSSSAEMESDDFSNLNDSSENNMNKYSGKSACKYTAKSSIKKSTFKNGKSSNGKGKSGDGKKSI